MPWFRVASVADMKPEEPLPVTIGNNKIAVYRLGDLFYALDDICPHAYALLSSGFIEGDCVECPLHASVFHIPTGKCLKPPAERDLSTYPLMIEGGEILIDV